MRCALSLLPRHIMRIRINLRKGRGAAGKRKCSFAHMNSQMHRLLLDEMLIYALLIIMLCKCPLNSLTSGARGQCKRRNHFMPSFLQCRFVRKSYRTCGKMSANLSLGAAIQGSCRSTSSSCAHISLSLLYFPLFSKFLGL